MFICIYSPVSFNDLQLYLTYEKLLFWPPKLQHFDDKHHKMIAILRHLILLTDEVCFNVGFTIH